MTGELFPRASNKCFDRFMSQLRACISFAHEPNKWCACKKKYRPQSKSPARLCIYAARGASHSVTIPLPPKSRDRKKHVLLSPWGVRGGVVGWVVARAWRLTFIKLLIGVGPLPSPSNPCLTIIRDLSWWYNMWGCRMLWWLDIFWVVCRCWRLEEEGSGEGRGFWRK